MTNPFKAVLRLVIAVTERALRPDRRRRCIRGASLAARAARRRTKRPELDPTDGTSDSMVAAAKT